MGGSAAAAAAAAAAGPAPDAEHAQHTQQAQQLEQHADLAAEHADLGMLHEQLQQHLAAQQVGQGQGLWARVRVGGAVLASAARAKVCGRRVGWWGGRAAARAGGRAGT